MVDQIKVSSLPVVEVRLNESTIHRLQVAALTIGRTLRSERRDALRYAIMLIEKELLYTGSSAVASWRVERVLERLRELLELEGE